MEEPMSCWIRISEINGTMITSKLAEVDLIDISKGGCKIRTVLDLHAASNAIKGVLRLKLTEEEHDFNAKICWQRQIEPPYYHYGLSLQLEAEEKEKINADLRTLAGNKKIKVI
ncbi:PilZ domain-containing protein [Paenibacillus sp. YPG26]|uniref:PilZ domain-containing protein n=1 Tax=Paenibacillus sp. YPG26 TaxID=2878915 RepID=UPI00203D873A|nr:PilZ domain-containing protein [Paenibacillus sp. YPG26]USB34218.1 PilZ domain-containing protein [Paenibacillus sp. YPG26]